MVGHSRRCTTRESTFTACLSPLFALFPGWDRTGCLKQWELDKGRERKTSLWSTNRKFQTPPPSSPTLIPGLTLIPVFNPPPPPPPAEDWPLFRVDPYSGFFSTCLLLWEARMHHSTNPNFSWRSCKGFSAKISVKVALGQFSWEEHFVHVIFDG